MARIVNPTVKKTISDKNNIIPIRSISWVSKRIVDHSDAEDPVFFFKVYVGATCVSLVYSSKEEAEKKLEELVKKMNSL